MLYDEIRAVIKRYSMEANLSYYLIIGALEAVKADEIKAMNEANKDG